MNKGNGITYVNKSPDSFDETVQLYKSVGLTRYTDFPDELMNAIQSSTYVISAYKNNQLIGLIRDLSDSVPIHFIQDLLVQPKYQRTGIGRAG